MVQTPPPPTPRRGDHAPTGMSRHPPTSSHPYTTTSDLTPGPGPPLPPRSKRARAGRGTTALTLAPARAGLLQRLRKGASAPTYADDRFDDSPAPAPDARLQRQAGVRHLGRGTRQPPGVAHVCFLRMRSSACRCRLDPGGSRLRPDPSVRGLGSARPLLSSRRRAGLSQWRHFAKALVPVVPCGFIAISWDGGPALAGPHLLLGRGAAVPAGPGGRGWWLCPGGWSLCPARVPARSADHAGFAALAGARACGDGSVGAGFVLALGGSGGGQDPPGVGARSRAAGFGGGRVGGGRVPDGAANSAVGAGGEPAGGRARAGRRLAPPAAGV